MQNTQNLNVLHSDVINNKIVGVRHNFTASRHALAATVHIRVLWQVFYAFNQRTPKLGGSYWIELADVFNNMCKVGI